MIDEHILREQQNEEAEAIAAAKAEDTNEPTQPAQPAAYSIEDKSKNPMSAVFGK
jgi:cell division protein FtsW